jgi:predicted nucleic acid-binding protein
MIGWNAPDDIFRNCRTGTEAAVDALDKARAERDALLAGRTPRPAAPLDRRRRVGTCQRADRRRPGRPDESRRTRPRLARAAPAHLVVVLGRAGPMPGEQDRSAALPGFARRLDVGDHRIAEHHPVLPRTWELRETVTGYDAACVAAAETYDCLLHTADVRLTRVGGLRCDIRLAVSDDH